MREQLIQYVNLLFAGSPDAQDIKQEILQNTLDRFDDLVAQGKSPEAAYSLAISGIGDINEILGSNTAPAQAPQPSAAPKAKEPTPAWKTVLRSIAVCLYIMCPIPLFTLQNELGLCGLLCFVGLATALMVIAGSRGKAQQTAAPERSDLCKGINSIIWIIGICIYFAVSIPLNAWYISWIIFPILGAVTAIVSACFDLKKHHPSAIARIITWSVVALLLLSIFGIVLGLGTFIIEFDFDSGAYTTGSATLDSAGIQKLDINWVDGDIFIETGDGNEISFSVNNDNDPDNPMVWKQEGDTLTINYSKPGLRFGFFSFSSVSKDLFITIPSNWSGKELNIDTVSGSVEVTGIRTDRIDLDATSADCTFIDCIVTDISMSSTSGDLSYTGHLNRLECDGVSAECTVQARNTPEELELDCVSGKLTITLPEDATYTADLDTVSGRISSEFSPEYNGSHTYGDGTCRIEADTVSGNIIIQKAD